MFKSLLPPWPGKRHAPKSFLLTCRECGFNKLYQQLPGGKLDAGDPEVVAKLPERCPKCGKKLRKKRLPAFIRY